MVQLMFVFAVLGVLLVPVQCVLVTVCVEDDEDLRVDCNIQPKISQINSYEFSWSSGSKEHLINTNVSGSVPDKQFIGRSYVEELEPHGYRMTLTGFTHTLPNNTTFMCKVSGVVDSSNVEKEHLVPCSAVSVFLQYSYSWIVAVLLLSCHTNMWQMSLR